MDKSKQELESKMKDIQREISNIFDECILSNLPYNEYFGKTESLRTELNKLNQQYVKLTKPTMYPMNDLDRECRRLFEDFKKSCESGFFISDDGFGYYATYDEKSDIEAIPEDIAEGYGRTDFDYVVWYNR